MPINLNALSTLSNAALSLANLILVTPEAPSGYQPQNKASKTADGKATQEPPTLLFHYEGEQAISLDSDITDHFIEDNTAIQDQISLRPEIIKVKGYIGELNNIAPKKLETLKTIAEKLYVLTAYVPILTKTALLLYNQAFQLYQLKERTRRSKIGSWRTVTNGNEETQTLQALMFSQFYGYWKDRTLFTVRTPWGQFKDCAILSLKAVQEESTRTITDFEITFKPLKFAKTVFQNAQVKKVQGRLNALAASQVDLGVSSPVESDNLLEVLVQKF